MPCIFNALPHFEHFLGAYLLHCEKRVELYLDELFPPAEYQHIDDNRITREQYKPPSVFHSIQYLK
jgi:hypothetical protein